MLAIEENLEAKGSVLFINYAELKRRVLLALYKQEKAASTMKLVGYEPGSIKNSVRVTYQVKVGRRWVYRYIDLVDRKSIWRFW